MDAKTRRKSANCMVVCKENVHSVVLGIYLLECIAADKERTSHANECSIGCFKNVSFVVKYML